MRCAQRERERERGERMRVRGDKGLQHSSRAPDAGARLGNRTSQGGREIVENIGFFAWFSRFRSVAGGDVRAPRGLSGCGADGMGRGEARHDGGEIRRV